MSEPTKAGFVAIIGKPNAGKSTLMNAIIGEKLSIVTPKPQTTRKKVLGIYTHENCQIVFHDTPGILRPKYKMHESMMNYVDSSIAESDIICVILDCERTNLAEPYFPEIILKTLKGCSQPKVLLLNKVDKILDKKDLLPAISKFASLELFNEIVPISALNNDNVKALVAVLTKYLPENEFYYDSDLLSIQNQRFFVSEIIRENIFTLTEEEIPYSTEVNIVEYKEREFGKWFIHAEIVVERDTQKRIIIGKAGSKIKEIGERSRKGIEKHLDLEVYLELFVKVRKDWRQNPGMLKSFGY